ncbi:extracellular solute-binding protein [Treponema sp. HNW]|uniref:extracellular solute-binding protein n=1 Tax=Treponema sp. HNW TaxID=3116654 RepID=UPI003D110239
MKVFIQKMICSGILILLVFLSGCAKKTTSVSEVTEITFLSNSVKPYDTAIPIMITEFEKQNPNIKVKVEMLPTKGLWEAVEIKLGAKEPTPDVLFVDSPLTTTYVMKGYLESLEDFFSNDERKQYVDICRQYGTVKGKLYAAPFVNSSQVLYYNTRLFDEAGIPRLSKDPKERLTWEEVIELAKKLTIDKDGDGVPEVFGLGISQISRPYQMLTMPQSLGGKAIGKDGLTVSGVFTDEAWLKACGFISDLFNVYKVSPKGVSASDMLAYFPSEKLAMLIGPDYNHLAYSRNESLTWDYAPYPYFKDGKPVTPTGSWSLGINKSSKNKAAAAKLIKFLTLYPSCIDWFNLDGHLPSNKRTLEYIAENEKFTKWPFDIFTLINYECQNTAIPRPLTPGYLEYESLLTNAFEDIRNGGDVKSILENAEVAVERMLNKYK